MKSARALLFAAFAGLSAASAFGAPAEVVIIRHGERPAIGNSLDAQGLQRSLALVDFFKNDPAVVQNGPPAAIYAMAPGKPDHSLRPIQTVTPLAATLVIPIDVKHAKNDFSKLTADVMRNPKCAGKTAVICWEHEVIPRIIKAFGYDAGLKQWPDDVFDRAVILKFDGDKVVSYQNIPQHLLPGDSDK